MEADWSQRLFSDFYEMSKTTKDAEGKQEWDLRVVKNLKKEPQNILNWMVVNKVTARKQSY